MKLGTTSVGPIRLNAADADKMKLFALCQRETLASALRRLVDEALVGRPELAATIDRAIRQRQEVNDDSAITSCGTRASKEAQ